MFFFVDIETTGLSFTKDIPLEIGVILTTDNLKFIDAYSRVLPVMNWDPMPLDDVVLEMHTKNGLLDELETMGRVRPYSSYDEPDTELYKWVYERILGLDTNLYPAGSSVHFDLRFIEKFFPMTFKLLHYRHLDLTSIKLFDTITGKQYDSGKEDPHRAIPDLLNDIDWLCKKLGYFGHLEAFIQGVRKVAK